MMKAKGSLTMTIAVVMLLVSCTARKDETAKTSNTGDASAVQKGAITNTGHTGDASAAQKEQGAVAATSPSDGVQRITVEDLRAALERGEAVVLDVRNEAQYRAGHIAGAKWIPYTEVGERGPRLLPRDKLIVTYCS